MYTNLFEENSTKYLKSTMSTYNNLKLHFIALFFLTNSPTRILDVDLGSIRFSGFSK